MVHISKKQLTEKELGKLFRQLNNTLGDLDEKRLESFLSDFLGEEEKVMFAKRLAAIVMLYREQSLYKVATTLKISSSTAGKIQTGLDTGKYDTMLSVIQKDKVGFLDLLDAIDSILHLGGILPHYGQTPQSESYRRRRKELKKKKKI